MSTKLLAAGIGLLLALGLVGGQGLAGAPDPARIISVTGEGHVAAAPDMATVQLGVNISAESAAEALAAASAATSAALERIEAAGVAARDVQTSGLMLNPRWDHRPEREGGGKIVGYYAANTVTVRLRDLSLLGGLLDEVVGAGANTFGGLTFGLSDPEPLRDEARNKAVADAIRKAELYAQAAGVMLGPVQSIAEQGGSSPAPTMMRAEMAMSDAVPIAEGEVDLNVQVHMTFAIGAAP